MNGENWMKFNWKVLLAFVVLVGFTFWGVNSLRARSYSGTDLNFGVGSGPFTVTNPSDEALVAQLLGSGPGTFTVSSTNDQVSGKSTRQGSGRNTTQLFEFELPPGISELTVTRGTGITFVANVDTPLEVTVQALNADDSLTTLVVAAIAILGSLFYLSRSNDHRWMSASRRRRAFDQAIAQETEQQTFERIAGRITPNKS